MTYKPKWFKDGFVIISNSPTCGINKDGLEQYKIDLKTGERSETEIDDRLGDSISSIISEDFPHNDLFICPLDQIKKSKIIVPQYHDLSSVENLKKCLNYLPGFKLKSLGELQNDGQITIFEGHGSPSSDQRVGIIPYIKVSDIRAGHINVNPTNLIPEELAKKFWKGDDSGLKEYDLISPRRASKNIGEFSVLMPGQEKIVLTKEVIILRSLDSNLLDQYYLMWALSLKVVREQWKRIVLMQTNREDVGNRIYEIQIPIPPSKNVGNKASQHFRNYYNTINQARIEFNNALKQDYISISNIFHS